MQIVLRDATDSDVLKLQEIGMATFSETFSAANSAENMTNYLRDRFSIEKLREELNNIDSQFFFALADDRVVGYLKVNFGASQTELKDSKALEIERIYVLHEFQGKKVGQLLYDKAIQLANQLPVDYVWLGVWEKNEKAIKFYTKNGFVEFDQHIFKLGDDEQTDLMMKLHLV